MRSIIASDVASDVRPDLLDERMAPPREPELVDMAIVPGAATSRPRFASGRYSAIGVELIREVGLHDITSAIARRRGFAKARKPRIDVPSQAGTLDLQRARHFMMHCRTRTPGRGSGGLRCDLRRIDPLNSEVTS